MVPKLLLACAAMMVASSVQAATLHSFSFDGILDIGSALVQSDPTAPFAEGDPFTVNFSYDTDISPTTISSDFNVYQGASMVSWSLHIGATTFTSNPGGNSTDRIQVIDRASGGAFDRFLFVDSLIDLPAGWSATGQTAVRPVFSVDLVDNSGTALSSKSLPTAFDLSAFPDVAKVRIEFLQDGSGAVNWPGGSTTNSVALIHGTLTAQNATVPEPASLTVFGLGTLSLVACQRCRRRKSD